ncbi:hypothetical protein CRUP_017735 [Coryphaenoides rupestris]|nr:hypothetical protein CRUP_017735 [Coryphaenoides rupestris]
MFRGRYPSQYGAMAAQVWSRPSRPYCRTELRGLDNYGLTCCVNALLQSFSATSELKSILDEWDASSVRNEAANVPFQLKTLLGDMWRDTSHPAPHRDFLRCLDRQHIRLNIQHDADEVFLAILGFMQQQMDDPALVLKVQSLLPGSPWEVHLAGVCGCCAQFKARPSYTAQRYAPARM